MNTQKLLCVITSFLLCTSITASTYFVSPVGTGSGTSWTTASSNLSAILDNALPGDEVWVAAGTYTPHPTDRTQSFRILDGVSVYGGFNGSEISRAERSYLANRTILSGDLLQNDLPFFTNRGDNAQQVVTSVGTSASTTIDGFVIQAGNANLTTLSGGGMYLSNSALTVKNCFITDNRADDWGGGAWCNGGSPTFENVYFLRNVSDRDGGGLNVLSAAATLTGCTFKENEAVEDGGGCSINSGFPIVISNCRFVKNESETGGGLYISGIGAYVDGPTIDQTLFAENRVTGRGGGCYNYVVEPTYTACLFLRNSASGYGGGFYAYDGMANVDRCGFFANSASWGAGLATSLTLNPDISNSVFIGNSAANLGGAIYGPRPRIYNCSVSGNSAGIAGGAMNLYNALIYNSVVWGNSSGIRTTSSPYFNDITYSCVEGGAPGIGNINLHPFFILEPNPNDAPTNVGNLDITDASPLVDAGNSALLPAGLVFDAKGDNRFVGAVDIGAFEFQSISRQGDPSAEQLSVVIGGTHLQINWKNFSAEKLEIYDVSGRLVHNADLTGSENNYQLPASGIAGMNFVILSGPSGVEMQSVFLP